MNPQEDDPLEKSSPRRTGLRTIAAVRVPRPVPISRARRYVNSAYWDERQLRDGIEAAASARPEGIAVMDDAGAVTWGALAWRVAAGMTRLARAGVGPGSAAVLIAGNTVEGVVAYHSLLRMGRPRSSWIADAGPTTSGWPSIRCQSPPLCCLQPSARGSRASWARP
jgi:hypothetical protein